MAIIYSAHVADATYINAHDTDIVSLGVRSRTRGDEIYVSQSIHLTSAQAREVGVALIAAADALDATKDGAP